MPQPIVYPRDLVDALLRAMSSLAHEPASAVAPSRPQLERILDVAWSATLLEEEGRRPVFTLGFVTEAEAVYTRCRVLALAEALPCSPPTVAKFALATDPRETILAVRWSDAGDLEIWALLQLGDRAVSIDLEIRPRFLHVTGFRPGGLVVEAYGRRLLLYMNGAAHWYQGGAENMTTLLRDALHPTAVRLGSSGGALAHEFERLAERLVLAGHGGTLLVADPTTDQLSTWQPAGVHIPTNMRFRAPDDCLKDAFLRQEAAFAERAAAGDDRKQSSRERYELERDHLSALDHVARLSNVDGAVVMSSSLSVHGFGATIALAEGTHIPPMDLVDLTTPGTPARAATIDEFQGHRHKSAVHFCAMQRDGDESKMALAIVASQDGTLSLFGSTTNGIAIYRPFILRSVSVR